MKSDDILLDRISRGYEPEPGCDYAKGKCFTCGGKSMSYTTSVGSRGLYVGSSVLKYCIPCSVDAEEEAIMARGCVICGQKAQMVLAVDGLCFKCHGITCKEGPLRDKLLQNVSKWHEDGQPYASPYGKLIRI